MNFRRYAFFAVAGIATTVSAQAHEGPAIGKVELVCPDRSVRTTDIELAVNAAGWRASQEQYLQMREHARSACAANLRVATLYAPEDSARDASLAYEPTR